MSENSINLQKVLSKIKHDADWLGLKLYTEETTYLSVHNEKPEHHFSSNDIGIRVEILKDGLFLYSSTINTDSKSLQFEVDECLKRAKILSKHSVYPFTKDLRLPINGEYTSPLVKKWESLSRSEISDLLHRLSKEMNIDKRIVGRTAAADHSLIKIYSVCTHGSNYTRTQYITAVHLKSVANKGNETQYRTNAGFRGECYQKGFEIFQLEPLIEKSHRISKEAIELIESQNCPDEKLDLLLSSDQMMLQIHESIGHPLELDRILGDERNYAGGSFVKLSDFGQLKYGSPILNVTFDPTIQDELGAYDYDESGLEAKKEFLIKDGVLVRGLGSLESQARSGIEGVANFRARSWNRAPIDRMANINLEPGHHSKEELISSIENGIYMESNRSWSIDDYRRKFQFGCEYARKIENGELTKVIKNPNYRGVSLDFWNQLKAVGDKSTFNYFGSPNCGKGEPNQSIWVGHGSPLCLFENIDVFGGVN